MPTELAIAIVAIIPTLAGILASYLTSKSNKKIDNLQKDVSVCKEASFASLTAHVENGANGDVKKAYERLKDDLFDRQ